MQFEAWQWAALGFGSFLAGLSKGGIAGLSVLNVAIFALLLPARQSVGIVLALYLCTDLVAVMTYRRHASWPHLRRLFPTAAIGVVLGYFALGKVNDAWLKPLIGAILLVLAGWELARRFRAVPKTESGSDETEAPQIEEASAAIASTAIASTGTTSNEVTPNGIASNEIATNGIAFGPALLVGLAGGFTTMVANAAGPLMVLYLIASGLPKIKLVGTAAWFFLVLNAFKVPFSVHLGLMGWDTLAMVAPLVPFSVAGALVGRFAIGFIPQKTFEIVALLLTLVAGARLMWP